MSRGLFYATTTFLLATIAFAALGMLAASEGQGWQVAMPLQVASLIIAVVFSPAFLAGALGEERARYARGRDAREEE